MNTVTKPVVYVSWPLAPLTLSLVCTSLAEQDISSEIVSSLPKSFFKLIQWSTYDSIDHELTKSRPFDVLSSSYTIRKALIRKHFLSRCIRSYITKHPESLLKNSVPRTWELDIAYADELDEMWSDELWDLGNELDSDNPLKSHWWILKPGMADKGMGIRLFYSKEALQDIFEEFDRDSEGEESDMNDTSVSTSQLRHFVVQEYLQYPLLLNPSHISHAKVQGSSMGHKFHLRVYCIAAGALKLYMYTRILALFSSNPYTPPNQSNGSIDLTPHLTNTSLQIDRGEAGVRLLDELAGCQIFSLAQDVNQTNAFTSGDIRFIKDQMANILAETFKAALEMPVHFQALPNAFELYGVDFLVSHEPYAMGPTKDPPINPPFQVRLLEVNAEPAIELTGARLTWILEDLFKAIGQVCVHPHFCESTEEGIDAESADWAVGEVRYNLHKCLEVQVRGSGGW
ncbi:hypothetical protein SERLA73DRAFT_101340 [Serpula lacrymans var. lacrymans S7.3]|uniref:Tubulin-tyrosine ligase n=2 Tax=Serpula lacrymans var. lacrymans TaxID=341189 RepID=F8PJL2_SERL3|nr:uncharacterized protein SERLADRAFT_444900 [Serpula lacrymans var. lacrymans S7.9]EGO03213.1 hypothetical protein SERLA73DRAFT_101340 [Serpula lacrymans var. lacrymans S7.3]EGO28992.1 hypothetical protein SERLADRAFT_444900 [Serpula lacrymans var. lacrymans S7.9]